MNRIGVSGVGLPVSSRSKFPPTPITLVGNTGASSRAWPNSITTSVGCQATSGVPSYTRTPSGSTPP